MLSLTNILGKWRAPSHPAAAAHSQVKIISPVEVSDIDCRHLRQLFLFWQEKWDERGALPSRADFTPKDIKGLLPYVAMVDVENAGQDFRFRVFGTRIAEEAGQDFSAKRWSDIAGAEKIIDRSRTLVQDCDAYFAKDIVAHWAPRHYKRYSVLALPLAKDGKTVDMILYGVVFNCP